MNGEVTDGSRNAAVQRSLMMETRRRGAYERPGRVGTLRWTQQLLHVGMARLAHGRSFPRLDRGGRLCQAPEADSEVLHKPMTCCLSNGSARPWPSVAPADAPAVAVLKRKKLAGTRHDDCAGPRSARRSRLVAEIRSLPAGDRGPQAERPELAAAGRSGGDAGAGALCLHHFCLSAVLCALMPSGGARRGSAQKSHRPSGS